jgi:hypothetical protein
VVVFTVWGNSERSYGDRVVLLLFLCGSWSCCDCVCYDMLLFATCASLGVVSDRRHVMSIYFDRAK